MPSYIHHSATRQVIVSLHDVAPPFEAAIRQQLALLAAIGVRRVVLKVVPNWHGAHPLWEAPSLVALLQAQAAAGSQLVLHGYEHHARGAFHGPWPRRLRARLFAVDAAEFLTLSTPQVEAAIHRGRAGFARCGLPSPTMFCAPGWLHNAAAEAALRRAGLRHLIGMFALRDLQTGHRLWTPGIGYMGASPGQELGVQLLNRIARSTARARLPSSRSTSIPNAIPPAPSSAATWQRWPS